MILDKNSKFLSRLLFFEKCLAVYFYDVVYKKEGFLDYKNVIFTWSKSLHFSKPMILVKNSKFLSSLLFIEKCLDMYFYDVVYKKKGFLECKNVIFTESKNLHFSKGVNP